MTNIWPTPHFPGTGFSSRAEYENHNELHRAKKDGIFAYEQGLGSKAAAIARPGTCAPCLRPATFTSSTVGGELLGDGRRVPNWREEQICDCDDHLPQIQRAALHLALSSRLLRPWTNILVLGPEPTVVRRIAKKSRSLTRISRLKQTESGCRIPAEDDAFHVAICFDYLQHVPLLDFTLSELARVVIPGGRLILSLPFRALSTNSVSYPVQQGLIESNAEVHEIGWDILDRMRAAGFAEAEVVTYWSGEFGYLGPSNLLLMGIR